MMITALVVSLSKLTKANTHTLDTTSTNHAVNEFSELITYSWKGNLI